jgi:hypothetical protein
MAGNYNDTVCIFNIDTVKPTIDIIAPIGGELLNYSKVEVSWSGSDNASGIADYWVNIDGGVWTNVTKNMSYSLVSLADGQHIISVKVEDNAGNSNESSVTFVVDTIAPTITAHSPTGPATRPLSRPLGFHTTRPILLTLPVRIWPATRWDIPGRSPR